MAVGFLDWILLLSTFMSNFTCIKLAKTCILKGAVFWTEDVWLGNVYKTPTPIVGMDKKVRLDTQTHVWKAARLLPRACRRLHAVSSTGQY